MVPRRARLFSLMPSTAERVGWTPEEGGMGADMRDPVDSGRSLEARKISNSISILPYRSREERKRVKVQRPRSAKVGLRAPRSHRIAFDGRITGRAVRRACLGSFFQPCVFADLKSYPPPRRYWSRQDGSLAKRKG